MEAYPRTTHDLASVEALLASIALVSYLLAMQKVVGSNPISRFGEGSCLQVFRGDAVGWTFCGAGSQLAASVRGLVAT